MNDIYSPLISKSLLNIQIDFGRTGLWMASTLLWSRNLFLTSKLILVVLGYEWFRFFFWFLVKVLGVCSRGSIYFWHYRQLHVPQHFHSINKAQLIIEFFTFFMFTRWSAGIVKTTAWQALFFLVIKTSSVINLESGLRIDLYII